MQRISCLMHRCQAINMALLKLAAQCQLPGSCPMAITWAVHHCCSPQQYIVPLPCSICACWLPCRSQMQPFRSCATRYSCRSWCWMAAPR